MKNSIFAQIHAHSRYSVNDMSGEGVMHRYVWPLERHLIKYLMLSPKKIAIESKKLGLSFVAITDHNTIPEIPENFEEFLIPGEEWGQNKGHANFINIKKVIEPEAGFFIKKQPKNPNSFKEAVKLARKQNSFVTINHPFKRDAWLWDVETFKMADAIEIWNGPWSDENRKALELWQILLEQGIKILGVTGNDFHVKHLFNLDENLIVMEQTKNKNEFLNKLRNGRYSLVKNKKTPYTILSDDLEYHIENYQENIELRIISHKMTKIINKVEQEGKLNKNDFKYFVRVEIWEKSQPLCFSNPVFF
ncbi:MAG: CehA/McbA family metallohydrolase [Thermoplasmata archaeon]